MIIRIYEFSTYLTWHNPHSKPFPKQLLTVFPSRSLVICHLLQPPLMRGDSVDFEQFSIFMQLHVRFVWDSETSPSVGKYSSYDRTAIDKCANP